MVIALPVILFALIEGIAGLLTKIGVVTKAANSTLNSSSKKFGCFTELKFKLELKKINFLDSNLNSNKIVRVRVH